MLGESGECSGTREWNSAGIGGKCDMASRWGGGDPVV